MTDASIRRCAARHCKTNDDTVIKGEKARLFEFPADPELRQKWKTVCNINVDKNALLCELHFDQSCFDDKKQLKPNAAPTYPVFKRKLDSASNDDSVCEKKAAVDTPRPLLEISYPCNSALNGSKPPVRKLASKNAFRLTIHIDKFPNKPAVEEESKTADCSQNEKQNRPRKGHLCLTCKNTVPNLQELYTHVMKHFTCDLCHALFTLNKSLQKHRKLHENNSAKFPFKCLKCDQAFVSEDDIRQHKHPETFEDDHQSPRKPVSYLCKKCNQQFKTKPDFDKHYAESHPKVETTA